MPRSLDPNILSVLASRKIKTAFLVAAKIGPEWVYLTTAARDVVIDDITYSSAQTLLVDGIEQNWNLQNSEGQISLSGIPIDYKALVFNQKYKGNPLIIYQGFFDFVTDALVSAPIKIHEGLITGMTFNDDPKSGTAVITLPISSVFARFNDTNSMLTNPSTHQRLFPNDRIFEQVPSLVDRLVEFGKL